MFYEGFIFFIQIEYPQIFFPFISTFAV